MFNKVQFIYHVYGHVCKLFEEEKNPQKYNFYSENAGKWVPMKIVLSIEAAEKDKTEVTNCKK